MLFYLDFLISSHHLNTLFFRWNYDGEFYINHTFIVGTLFPQSVHLIDLLRASDYPALQLLKKYVLIEYGIFGERVPNFDQS